MKEKGRKENLDPCRDTETAKARGKQGGIKSGEVRKERKRMSQMYADFLAATHEIEIDEKKEKLEGSALLAYVMKQVLVRGDSASVSMLKEIREATEGSNIKITSELPQVIMQGPDGK